MRYDYNDVLRWTDLKPKRVQHGIKAIHQKGNFYQEWWGKRWISIIDSFYLGERLARGKRYARSGQVVDINFHPGKITASVQGTMYQPYQIEISINVWTEKEWNYFFRLIRSDPILLSQMISGKLTPELEKRTQSHGILLFPTKFQDFQTSCTCPDWSNPCKHVAAVFFLITEYLDKNPFLLLELRGKDQSDIIENLLPSISEEHVSLPEKKENKISPLSTKYFWEPNPACQIPVYFTKPIECDALLIHQMGSFPLWQANDDFFEWWETLYRQNTEKIIQEMEQQDPSPED
jgi:uncharacterized Zn finger protein